MQVNHQLSQNVSNGAHVKLQPTPEWDESRQNQANGHVYPPQMSGIGPGSGTVKTNKQNLKQSSMGGGAQLQSQQPHYQHISIGIKSFGNSQNQTKKSSQARSGAENNFYHQKTVSNGSTIVYPFQTSQISTKLVNGGSNGTSGASSHLNSNLKPQRASQLIQEQIHLGGTQAKNRQTNEFFTNESKNNENFNNFELHGAQAVINGAEQFTSHSLINVSPSPRGRPFQMQIAQVGIAQSNVGQSATLAIGSNQHSVQGPVQGTQSRVNGKQIMQTETKASSNKQRDPFSMSLGQSAKKPMQAVATTSFSIKFGSPIKTEKDPYKKTVNKSDENEANFPANPPTAARASTGLNRKFVSQKNSQKVAPNVLNGQIASNGYPKSQSLAQELAQLGTEAFEKLDDVTAMKIQDIQRFVQNNNGIGLMDNSQILQFYQMATGQAQHQMSNTQYPIPQHKHESNPKSVIKINQILSGDSTQENSSATKKRGVIQHGQGPFSANSQAHRHQTSGAKGSQAPRSAASNTFGSHQSQNYNAQHASNANGLNATVNQQHHNSNNHQQKRESYNFVSEKQKQVVASQDKLRRNLSKEYCPMIIKSSNNKGMQGANNAQIVKGVLTMQQKQRIESSLRKTPVNGARITASNSIKLNEGQDNCYEPNSEIMKTQSHQVLMRGEGSSPDRKDAQRQSAGYEKEFGEAYGGATHVNNDASPFSDKNLLLDDDLSPLRYKHYGAGEGSEMRHTRLNTTADIAGQGSTQLTVNSYLNHGGPMGQGVSLNGESQLTQVSQIKTTTKNPESVTQTFKALVDGSKEVILNKSPTKMSSNDQLVNSAQKASEDNQIQRRIGSSINLQGIKSPQSDIPLHDQNERINSSQHNPKQASAALNYIKQDASPKSKGNIYGGQINAITSGHSNGKILSSNSTTPQTSNHHRNSRARFQNGRQVPSQTSYIGQLSQSTGTNKTPKHAGTVGHSSQVQTSTTDVLSDQSLQPNQDGNAPPSTGIKGARASNKVPHQTLYQVTTGQANATTTANLYSASKASVDGSSVHTKQRTTGVRGSSTLAQNTGTNNNANSQSHMRSGASETKQSRAMSHYRNQAGKQEGGQGPSAATATQGGGFLRPKVLDFQPKSGQVDPLLAHRSRKRAGQGINNNHNHNQMPGINMQANAAFNQNHHHYGGGAGAAGARISHAGNGVFRHF